MVAGTDSQGCGKFKAKRIGLFSLFKPHVVLKLQSCYVSQVLSWLFRFGLLDCDLAVQESESTQRKYLSCSWVMDTFMISASRKAFVFLKPVNRMDMNLALSICCWTYVSFPSMDPFLYLISSSFFTICSEQTVCVTFDCQIHTWSPFLECKLPAQLGICL
jgi:hypothetical protein